VANNTLKYQRIDPVDREQARRQWNTPSRWPLLIIVVLGLAAFLPAVFAYRRRERSAGR